MNLADKFSEWFQLVSRDVFEPSLNWVLSHPILSVLVVGLLIFFSVRNYRML